MPNPAFGGQFGSENKLIEGQPNEYDVICRNASVLAVPPVANDICRSAVPAPKYLPERRSTAFPHQYTPGCMAKIYRVIRIKISLLVLLVYENVHMIADLPTKRMQALSW